MAILTRVRYDTSHMPRTVSPLLPATQERLRQFGERLRLARRRRRLSATQVAARAGMAPMTLRSVERGGAGVTIGAYAAVMQVLGIEQDLELLAAADPTGRALQDARLSAPRTRPPVSASASQATPPGRPVSSRSGRERAGASVKPLDAGTTTTAGFASARSLARLLETPARPRPRTKRR